MADAAGSSSALLLFSQLTLRYNVPPPKSAVTFDLRVETEPKECTESARSHFGLVVHARYEPQPPTHLGLSSRGQGQAPGSREMAGAEPPHCRAGAWLESLWEPSTPRARGRGRGPLGMCQGLKGWSRG